MTRNALVAAFGLSASLLGAQGALASQDPAFGYDAFYQFGFERAAIATADTSHLYKRVVPSMSGYEVDYVYGSDARAIARANAPSQTAMQIRDALGAQPGA